MRENETDDSSRLHRTAVSRVPEDNHDRVAREIFKRLNNDLDLMPTDVAAILRREYGELDKKLYNEVQAHAETHDGYKSEVSDLETKLAKAREAISKAYMQVANSNRPGALDTLFHIDKEIRG